MRNYELMTIYHPELAEAEARARVQEAEKVLQSRGATIAEVEFWGKRRFAYPIEHLTEGYYSVIAFAAEPTVIQEVGRGLSLSDAVVRHKFIRMEPAAEAAPAGAEPTLAPTEPSGFTGESIAPSHVSHPGGTVDPYGPRDQDQTSEAPNQ